MASKLAIITGGSRGLGKNTALKLAQRGVDVIFTYHGNAEAAQEVVSALETTGQRAAVLRFDVGNIASFPDFVRQLQQLLEEKWQRSSFDFLVNNAGVGIHAPFAATTEQQFDTLFNVHFKGVFFLTQSLLPLIADGGRIVNVSSGLTRFALPGHAAYASMKGAVEVLSRYLAKELGERRITVNAVAPGAVETDFGGGVVRDNSGVNQFIAAQTALGRAGLPDDIGGAIASLLSEDMGWINAQRIEISGGMFI